MRVSVPLAGLVIGFLTGAVDAAIAHVNPVWASTTAPAAPPYTWVAVIWTWMTIGCLAGILFSSPRLGRLRAIVLALACPGLLLLSRTASWLKETVGWPSVAVLAAIVAATLVLAIPIALIRFETARAMRTYVAATIISVALIVFWAADVRLPKRTAVPRSHSQRNVVLVFLDTVRYDDALRMPQLAAFSRRAVTFDNAWSPSPWTVPSHFAVLTGVDPWTVPFDAKQRQYQTSVPTLAGKLRARGYDTGAVFANHLLTGDVFARGFDELRYTRSPRVCLSGVANLVSRSWLFDGPRVPLCGVYLASDVSDRARAFIREAKKPYFLAVNYMDAHEPYYVPPECRDASFAPISRRERQAVVYGTGFATAPRVHAQYRVALQCLDRSLGALLRDAQADPNTVIAIVADHGEQFGEHGLGNHGNSLYRQLVHVPLVLHAPGLAPAHVAEPVSITDLHSSLLALASDQSPALFHARRPAVARLDPISAPAGAFSVTHGGFHFIRYDDGREELFGEGDAGELAPISAPRQVLDPLRDAVARAARTRSPDADFRALGYLH